MKFLPLLAFALIASIANAQSSSDASKPKTKKRAERFAWVNPLPANHHPAVKHATMRSPWMGVDVGYTIVLPPSYASDSQARFSIIYYLHGGRPGSETKSLGLVKYWFEAMRSGTVAPMIYVLVNGGPATRSMGIHPSRG